MTDPERRMPFMEHLRELRSRLRNSIIALMVTTAVAFYFSEWLFVMLCQPLLGAFRANHLPDPHLNFGSMIEPFWVYFKIALYAGIFVASPIIFYQLWGFVAPGLHKHEKRIALPFAIFSALCFIGGALFCYFFVFPAAFNFFLSYSNQNLSHLRGALGLVDAQVGDPLQVRAELFMEQYLDLSTKMLLGFGLVFELPMLIFFLSMVGLVTHRSLWKFNKYAIVISFVVGAILTPGPDVVSQLLMATPMVVLYNLSIVIAFVVTKRRESRLGASPPPADPPATSGT